MTVLRNLLVAFALLLAIPADAASRFGVCTVTCTWDTSSTAMWSASTGGATGASVPGSGDTVTFDGATCVGGVTCTITIAAATNPTIQSFTWGACTGATTGCIIDNSANNNFTLTGPTNWFNGSGTGTRTFTAGSGTYTISGNFAGATAWSMITTTNLNVSPQPFASATVVLSGTGTVGGTFASGSLSYGTLTLTGHANKAGYLFTGAASIGVSNITAPNVVYFTNGVTTTITTAFNWSGTSTDRIMIASASTLNVATISIGSGTAVLDWGILRNITTTGGTARNATNTLDMGGNTWSSITVPPTGGGQKIICGSLQPRKLTWNDLGWKKCAA